MNLIENAVREKFRFPTTKGVLTTEDLWSLPCVSDERKTRNGVEEVSLNGIYTELSANLDVTKGKSLVNKTKETTKTEKMLEVVKYIFDVKTTEEEAKKQETAIKENNAKIRQLIIKKQEQSLENLSLEELEKLLK